MMSHPPSKAELEAVWNGSQIGWLKAFNKRTKNAKKFEVTVRPYTKNYLEPVSKIIYAKNYKQAQYERCHDELKAKYPEHFEKSQYGDWYYPKEGFVTETRVKEVT